MSRVLRIFAIMLLAGAGAGIGLAQEPCAGGACDVVSVSADGCQWTNKGAKAVRFALSSGGAVRIVTVLAAGESYRERDKAHCAGRFDASFVTLAQGAPDKPAPPKPRPKPETVAAATTPSNTPSALISVPPDAAAKGTPLPREKPAPRAMTLPRAKPAPGGDEAAANAPGKPSTVVVLRECDKDCPPILFKVIDECLWVLNLNPRRVGFEAEALGKRWPLILEAADGAKADERSAAIAGGKGAKDEASVYMRLADPFQRDGSGIPIYRARLGAKGACVTGRDQVTRFWAAYVK